MVTVTEIPDTNMIAPHLLKGRRGERIACRFLLKQGFDVLARRYRSRSGELDIIAYEGDTLVFVEVKTRSSREFGEPWEFVDWQKQQILRRAAEDFIAEHDLGQYTYRFDIVSVLGTEATLFRNVF
jgi:putative endonuclease